MKKLLGCLFAAGVAAALAGCSFFSPGSAPVSEPMAPDGPTSAAHGSRATAVAAASEGPGPMAEGTFLVASWSQLSTDDLRELVPQYLFDPDPAGAPAAAYVYLSLVSRSFASVESPADTSVMSALATDTCEWCATRVQMVHYFASLNLRVVGWTLSDSELGTLSVDEVGDGEYEVAVPGHLGEVQIWNPDGSLNASFPPKDDIYRVRVLYADGMWRIAGVAEEPLA